MSLIRIVCIRLVFFGTLHAACLGHFLLVPFKDFFLSYIVLILQIWRNLALVVTEEAHVLRRVRGPEAPVVVKGITFAVMRAVSILQQQMIVDALSPPE